MTIIPASTTADVTRTSDTPKNAITCPSWCTSAHHGGRLDGLTLHERVYGRVGLAQLDDGGDGDPPRIWLGRIADDEITPAGARQLAADLLAAVEALAAVAS